jgi:hypothetical protein
VSTNSEKEEKTVNDVDTTIDEGVRYHDSGHLMMGDRHQIMPVKMIIIQILAPKGQDDEMTLSLM